MSTLCEPNLEHLFCFLGTSVATFLFLQSTLQCYVSSLSRIRAQFLRARLATVLRAAVAAAAHPHSIQIAAPEEKRRGRGERERPPMGVRKVQVMDRPWLAVGLRTTRK